MAVSSKLFLESGKGLHIWEMSVIMLLSVWMFVPQVRPSFLICDVFFLTYAFISSVNDSLYRKKVWLMLSLIIYVALLYTLLNDASSISYDVDNYRLKRFISKASQFMTMFFPLCILYRVNNYATKKQQYILLLVVFISMLYLCLVTLSGIKTDLMAARNLSFAEDRDFSLAGYYEVYAYSFLSLLFFLLFFVRRKLIYILFFLFFFYFLYRVQFTLALVIVAVSMAYMVLKLTKNHVKTIVYLIGIITVVIVLPTLLEKLMTSMDTDLARMKAAEISGFLRFEYDEESDLWGRMDLYWKSIQAFVASPIWGNRTLPFDGHATLLMCFADLGILGGIPVWYLFIKANKIVKQQMKEYANYFSPFFFMLIFDGLTNPIHTQSSLYMVLWFFIPLVIMNSLSLHPINIRHA